MQEQITPTVEPFTYQPAAPISPFTRSPNDPAWSSGLAVGMWFVSVLLIMFVPLVFLAPYAISIAKAYPTTEDMVKQLSTDPFAIALQIAAIIPAHIITLFLAYLLVTQGRKFPFLETLGWRSGGIRWWHYIVILVGFFSLAALISQVLPEHETELERILKSSRSAVLLVAFMATFTAPLVEEVIYRGVLFSALQRTIGTGSAVGLVTFLFTLVHVPQYFESASTLILLAILSLVLTLVRVKTDNLLPCVILHTLFNGIQSIGLVIGLFLSTDSNTEEAVSTVFFFLK
ncbi:MAG: CPBP family intramembrane metalloprotease [Acidobacteria bacterium]|nr:CPBP family intramembrane metalloprotease [Acidobacteriota bacterium]